MRLEAWAAAALIAAAPAAAMGRRPPVEKNAMTTAMEWKGQTGGPAQPSAETVADAASWERVWRALGKTAPALDFSHFVAVVVYVGEKPTGGYSPVFEEPALRGEDLLVRYRVPPPSGFAVQAFSRAWKARAFPRPKGRVLVEEAQP